MGDERPFGGKVLIADTSAWARATSPQTGLDNTGSPSQMP